MNEKPEIKENRPFKLFGIMLPRLPGLMFRLGGTFIRFKGQASKAKKVFKKELINQGIDKDTAEELTRVYMQGSNIRNYMQNIG